ITEAYLSSLRMWSLRPSSKARALAGKWSSLRLRERENSAVTNWRYQATRKEPTLTHFTKDLALESTGSPSTCLWHKGPMALKKSAFESGSATVDGGFQHHRPVTKRQAGRDARRVRAFFFGAAVVARARCGGWLSMAARKMRLMRVW